jgi:hypothetical protein
MRGNTPTEKQDGYSGKVPMTAIIALEHELAGLVHGTASLAVHIRDGKLARFTTGRECSFIGDGTEQSDQLLTGAKK